MCEKFLWTMPESGTHTSAPFASARTPSRGHTPVSGRMGEECPRRRGNRVGDRQETL